MKKLGLASLSLLGLPLLMAPLLSAQDVPDGPGKDTLMKVCTTCHDLGVLASMNGTSDVWQSVIDDMKSRGADGTDDDFKAIITYLSKYYGPAVKINTDAEAAAIVKYRTDNGNLHSWDDLMKVPGLDMTKLQGLQNRIKFM